MYLLQREKQKQTLIHPVKQPGLPFVGRCVINTALLPPLSLIWLMSIKIFYSCLFLDCSI